MSTPVTDLDPRQGYISVALSFGPNAINGVVNESVVTSYVVFMADGCSRKLGEAVAVVQRHSKESVLCCQPDAYKVRFTVKLPFNVSEVALMIVPNTTAGVLSVGDMTAAVMDNASWGTGSGSVGQVSAAFCLRALGGMAFVALPLLTLTWPRPCWVL